MTHRDPAIDVDALLDQAEDFVRAGDYLEAQARARRASDEVEQSTAAPTRARVARMLERCEALAGEWQANNGARSAAHVARERKAIGADEPQPVGRLGAFREALGWLRSAWQEGGLFMSWFKAWLGYGLGRGAAKAILGEDEPEEARPPVRPQTEAEIRADEKRHEEDAKRLGAEDEAAKRRDAG